MSDSGDTASGGGASASRDSGERGAIRTVQEYIDETPFWSDGTTVSSPPMTAMQWRIWTLATAGKFFEGLMVFMTGVALPLLLRSIGTEVLLYGLMGTSLLGAVVTWVFRIETTGVNLERIE